MSLVAIIVALVLTQWHAFPWRAGVERAFVRYARFLEGKLNGGTREHGVIAALAAVAPPVVVATLAFYAADAVHPLLGLAVNVIVLYGLMGFRRVSEALSGIVEALQANDLHAARRTFASWRGGTASADLGSAEIARLAIERGLVDAYRQVFAPIFWFAVLPGPAGAVLYRATALLAEEWRGPVPGIEPTPLVQSRAEFGVPARALLGALDWLPVRLTALSFAVVGDFEDAIACWRTQAARWAAQDGGRTVGVLLAAGGGALGVQLGGVLPTSSGDPDVRPDLGLGDPVEPDVLPSAIGLVWRALVLWLLVMLLLTTANLAP